MEDADELQEGSTELHRKGHSQTVIQKWHSTSLPNKLMAGATVVIALAALVNLAVASAQWVVLRRQWSEMHNAGTQTDRIIAADERLATAMENSITQTKMGLDQSIEISRLDQRAWIGPIQTTAAYNFTEGKTTKFGVMIINTGKTPGRHMTTLFAAHVYRTGEDFKPIYDIPKGDIPSLSVIQPGMTLQLQSGPTLVFTASDINLLRHGDYVYKVYGRIRYDDISGRSHETTFCFAVQPDLTSSVSCESYNDAN